MNRMDAMKASSIEWMTTKNRQKETNNDLPNIGNICRKGQVS